MAAHEALPSSIATLRPSDRKSCRRRMTVEPSRQRQPCPIHDEDLSASTALSALDFPRPSAGRGRRRRVRAYFSLSASDGGEGSKGEVFVSRSKPPVAKFRLRDSRRLKHLRKTQAERSWPMPDDFEKTPMRNRLRDITMEEYHRNPVIVGRRARTQARQSARRTEEGAAGG